MTDIQVTPEQIASWRSRYEAAATELAAGKPATTLLEALHDELEVIETQQPQQLAAVLSAIGLQQLHQLRSKILVSQQLERSIEQTGSAPKAPYRRVGHIGEKSSPTVDATQVMLDEIRRPRRRRFGHGITD